MEIVYNLNPKINGEDLAGIFRRSGIKRPVEDLERMQRIIDHADVIIAAWDGDRLVGVARAITDYVYCCYLSDLAVDQEYQKQGIGKELVRRLQEQLGDEVSLLLLSAPTAMEYYPKIGFEQTDRGFIVTRKK